MTRKQFMGELRSSLEGIVSPMVVQQNIDYYENYINEQIRSGKTEAEILNELGSPRLIARSIIDAAGWTIVMHRQNIMRMNRRKLQRICLVEIHIFSR